MSTTEGIGERLKYARERAGLTQADVSARLGIGESSLSEFERGKREPAVSQLAALAGAYSRPVAFFLESGPLPVEVVRWREEPKEARAIEVRFLRLCEQYRNLETWCGATVGTSLPSVDAPATRFSRRDAAALASQVRRELALGDRPGASLLSVLEEQCGVKVFHLDFEPRGTAASSHSAGFGNAVLLNKKNPKWRRNFDLAHELFHLLTWNFVGSSSAGHAVWSESDEKLADEFAACLLMPEDAIREAVRSRLRDGKLPIGELFEIARQFEVSVEAATWRIHSAYGGTPKDKARTKAMLQRAREATEYVLDRPHDEPPQRPARFVSLALTALREGDLSIGRFAEYVGTTRQRAMALPEQEPGDNDALELPPP